MRPLTYFVDPDFNEDWSEYYDKNAIEIINYVFEEDFAYCGYRKFIILLFIIMENFYCGDIVEPYELILH